MTLHYSFDGIMCDVLDKQYTHFYDEQNYSREECDDVEFDYEVDISYEDVFDYLKPFNWEHWPYDCKSSYTRGFNSLWDNDLIDLERLEDDEGFIEFMKERYEEDARNACEEENS